MLTWKRTRLLSVVMCRCQAPNITVACVLHLALLVPMLHAKCQQDLAAVRAELTAQIDELRGTQLAMLSAFATAWPLLKQHEPLTLPSLVPTLQLVLPRAVAANATEADARVGALLQENARLRREARIVAEERDSAVDSLERIMRSVVGTLKRYEQGP